MVKLTTANTYYVYFLIGFFNLPTNTDSYYSNRLIDNKPVYIQKPI